MFTKMTNDGDSKIENDESGKKQINQHSAYVVEKSMEMETWREGGEEEVIITGT